MYMYLYSQIIMIHYSIIAKFKETNIWVDMYLFFFQSWPDDALTIVARRFLDDVEMEDKTKESCVDMCKEFHQTTRKLSDKYLDTLQRHNYVTPTSYLELISTYKTLLAKKRR